MRTIWLVSVLSVVAANVATGPSRNPQGGVNQHWQAGAQYPPWFADRGGASSTTTTTKKPQQGGNTPPQKPQSTPKPQGTTQKPQGTSSKPGTGASKKCAQPRGQFAHEKNCDQYYNCWDETVLVQTCQKGLVFNPKKRYCDYPSNVDCATKGVSTPPKITSCKTPYGSYRSPKNCSEFYVCSAGTAYKFSCPQGTRYNTDLGVCDYPYKVNCDTPPKAWWVEEESQPAYVPSVPEQSYYPENNIGSRYPEYEESYQPNQPDYRPSQPDYQPSQPDYQPSQPDYQPSQPDYQPSPPYYPAPETQAPVPEAPAAAGCQPNSIQTLSDGCTSVVACWGGIPTVVNCPEGTKFDTRRQRCDFDYRAECELR